MFAEGQIEGPAARRLGYTLSEGLLADEGEIVNGSFADYKIPRAVDMPPVHSILVDSNEPVGPFVARGLEIGLSAVAPAIASAIYDAVGIRLKELRKDQFLGRARGSRQLLLSLLQKAPIMSP